MSSPEGNAELLRSYVTVLRDEGIAAVNKQFDRFIHPDIEWVPGLITLGQSTYHGADAFRAYIREAAPVSDGSLTIREVRPVGEDCALALTYIDYKSKDESFYSEYALAARVKDDQLCELRGFISYAKAEEAVEAMATSSAERSSDA